jgi:hypothetical protein
VAPATGHLTVNGIQYAFDTDDVGLFSVEKRVPVLSREYQQENYVPRTTHTPTTGAQTDRVDVYTPAEPIWPPGASPCELVYNRFILEYIQRHHTPDHPAAEAALAGQVHDTQAQQNAHLGPQSPPPTTLGRTGLKGTGSTQDLVGGL